MIEAFFQWPFRFLNDHSSQLTLGSSMTASTSSNGATADGSGQSHTRSYYAATRNDFTRYAALDADARTDVCVLGAGFTGIATALSLAERGYTVTVLEQHRVGWGASGRNGGQIIGGISGAERMVKRLGGTVAETIWDMGWRGHEIIDERVLRYGVDCDLKRGYLDVAIKARHLDALRRDLEAYRAHSFGDQVRLIDAAETAALLGTMAYIGGLLNDRNGHLHPLNLCLGEARAAAALGVAIHEDSEVIDIGEGQPVQVRTRTGTVTADAVVIAGNAYYTLRQTGLAGRMFPAGSYIVATEPLGDEVAERINPRDLAVCDPNHVLDYFRLSVDKRLLFGGRCNYSGRVPSSIEAAIGPRLSKIYPDLADRRIDYAWGGNIAIVINRVPLLGRLRGNVYYSMGYSGHGVNFSHVAGEIMADAVGGSLERLDLFQRIRHWPVPGSRTFGNQLVALGMLYFRLRDLL